MNQLSTLYAVRRLAALACLAGLALLGGGCATTTPNYDAQFGNSVRAAIAQQTVNPAAARNADPVSGMDGMAARNAQTKYEASFATPAHADPSLMDGGRK